MIECACKEQVCMGDVKLMCHVPLKPIGRLKAIVDVWDEVGHKVKVADHVGGWNNVIEGWKPLFVTWIKDFLIPIF